MIPVSICRMGVLAGWEPPFGFLVFAGICFGSSGESSPYNSISCPWTLFFNPKVSRIQFYSSPLVRASLRRETEYQSPLYALPLTKPPCLILQQLRTARWNWSLLNSPVLNSKQSRPAQETRLLFSTALTPRRHSTPTKGIIVVINVGPPTQTNVSWSW